MSDVFEFLTTSNDFSSIVFKGFFDMPIDHLELMYRHYQKTEENLLDLYCKIKHSTWNTEKDNVCFNGEEAYSLRDATRNEILKQCFTEDELMDARYYSSVGYNNFREQEIWAGGERRREATKYIQTKEIRDWVFNEYGKLCLCCGSGKNLSIDHIIPISKKGKDEKDNLQPLCKPCNSRKHDNIKDYR